MNWPVFLIGIIVGWIIEWVIDLLFWRKRQKKWVAAESEYRTQLADTKIELEDQKAEAAQIGAAEADLVSAQVETDTLRSQLADTKIELEDQKAEAARVGAVEADLVTALAETDTLRSQLATAEAERDRLGAQLASVDRERRTLIDRFRGLAALAATAPAAAGVGLAAMARGEAVDLEELGKGAGDDLTMLEGVGPKIQELLYQNGIHTYAELADCDVERLRAILAGGGAAFRMADPASWPQQARLAAAHDWVRLQRLNEQLKGGVRRATQPAPEDDLTMIEGIGPKISASLKEHGIRTFAQLARTDVERLRAILAEAGPAFKLAAPAVESWPEQGRLAADGAWDQLHALKDTLKAGRGDAS